MVAWYYPVSGLAVGLLVGLTGVAGGSLMTPLLVLAFGVHPTTAVGTDLLCAAATKACGTVAHDRIGSVDWRIVARLACGSIPGAALTLAALRWTGPQSAQVSHAITFTLGLALIGTALATFFRGWTVRHLAGWMGQATPRKTARLTVASGLLLGVLVSLSSVGAGALGVIALIVLYPAVPLVRIIGSDIAHAVPLTLLAGLGHWYMGDVDWALWKALVVGSVPGILAGSLLAPRIPELALRPVLASVLLVVGGRLVA